MARGSTTLLHEMAVGITVVLSLVIFAGAILVLGQETKLFDSKMSYRTNLPDASGLRVGSPVTMAGVRVGNVSRIYLPTDPKSAGIEVFVSVDSDYAPRVRQDTTATPVILQLVSNEKSIDLTPGTLEKPALRDGDFITPNVPESLFEKGGSIADTVETITADLREILVAIREGKGVLGKAIVDPEFGQEGLERAVAAMTNAERVLERMAEGDGLIGKLLVDDAYADRVSSDLAAAAAAVRTVGERVAAGDGLAGQMTTKGEADSLLADLGRTAAALAQIAEDLRAGKGLAGALFAEGERAERVASNLDASLANLASITGKIDRGEGTLGKLVNDPALHDDTQLLIRGVRESKIATWLLRRFYENGRESSQEGAPPSALGKAPEGGKGPTGSSY